MSRLDVPQGDPPPVFGVPGAELVRVGQVAALLVLLAMVLLPAWARSGEVGTVQLSETGAAARMAYGADLLKTAMTPWLLPALGLLWVVGAGGIDLSVWVVFSLGAAVGARAMGAGASPLAMLAAVAAVGLGVGALHASAVCWLRLPSWGVTLLTAVAGVSVVAALTGGRPLPLALSAEFDWPGADQPTTLTGWFFAVALLSGLFLGHGRRGGQAEGAGVVAASLATSAVLSALGGLCWLVRAGWTPAPGHLVGDLRVAAAVALAGAVVLRTYGGRLIAGLLLAPAMLVATAWRQCVDVLPAAPAEAGVLLLAAMALAAQWTVIRGRRTGRPVDAAVALAAPAGIVLVAGSVWAGAGAPRAALVLTGLTLWATPAVLGLIAARKRPRPVTVEAPPWPPS